MKEIEDLLYEIQHNGCIEARRLSIICEAIQ